jgi:hypothetical protein
MILRKNLMWLVMAFLMVFRTVFCVAMSSSHSTHCIAIDGISEEYKTALQELQANYTAANEKKFVDTAIVCTLPLTSAHLTSPYP